MHQSLRQCLARASFLVLLAAFGCQPATPEASSASLRIVKAAPLAAEDARLGLVGRTVQSDGLVVTLGHPAFSIAKLRPVLVSGNGTIEANATAQIEADIAKCASAEGKLASTISATLEVTQYLDALPLANEWELYENCCSSRGGVANCDNDTIVKAYDARVTVKSTNDGSLDLALSCAPQLAKLAASGHRNELTEWTLAGWGLVETVPTWSVCENTTARRAR
jgi:hypothetical protein